MTLAAANTAVGALLVAIYASTDEPIYLGVGMFCCLIALLSAVTASR